MQTSHAERVAIGEAMPANFDLEASIQDNGDGRVTVRWDYSPEDFPKFVVLAKQATHVMSTPLPVMEKLYTKLMTDACNKKLFVDPSAPEVKAYQAEHGEAPTVNFLTGFSFFEATFDKMYTHVIFSLFGSPGATSALDMQLKSFNASRKGTETSEQKAERIVDGVMEMLKQIDLRRQAKPDDPPWVPTEEQIAEANEAAVHVKKEHVGDDGVPPMPEGAVVKEEPM